MSAFDDELVIAGQGTIGLELAEQVPDLDVVVVPCGGGGLLSGIAIALRALKPSVRIVGVQAAGCDPMVSSVRLGRVEPVTRVETIADGIAVKRPGEITFPIVRDTVDELVTVGDEEIVETINLLLERHKLLVEGAGAAAAAAVVERADRRARGTLRRRRALGREHRPAADPGGGAARPDRVRALPGAVDPDPRPAGRPDAAAPGAGARTG